MDPNATWLIINNEDLSADERMLAADNLLNWLDRGGFGPAGVEDPRGKIEALIEDLGTEMMNS